MDIGVGTESNADAPVHNCMVTTDPNVDGLNENMRSRKRQGRYTGKIFGPMGVEKQLSLTPSSTMAVVPSFVLKL